MGLIKYKIGELIELVQEINSELKYGPDDVRGMTITKEIIPTKADVSGTDLSKFLVVHPREFIYNPRTHGKRIGFGYNNSKENFIISWNNIAFRVKKSMENIVLADYLFLHFKRDEWDREACFQSWGSSTEVFSWESLCDMTVDLPNISVQKKYVDIYNVMFENQRNYERGLDDLKLVCDAYIENLRREIPCEAIGHYIEEVNQKNVGKLKLNSVRGIATSKEFINTKANMDGVSLENYKIVEPGMIAFISDTSRRADKMSIALNQSEENYIVSSISTVIQTDNTKLLPKYMHLFFCRTEFDRYARFHSWGSARETFSLDDMKEVRMPLPSIDVQNAIVGIYEAYTLRKEINEKLKAQIKDICSILIKGSIEEARKAKEA